MAIQILSDLHLESPKAYDTFEVTPSAPYLALLGDIGLAARHKDDLLAFLTAQLRQFRAVLFVPGNHEAYHSSWPEVLSILRDFERDVANNNSNNNNRESLPLGTFVLLDRAVFRPPDAPATVVLGCSLFSAVPPESAAAVGDGLNDFYQTGAGWDVAAHNNAHARDLAWLNTRVAELENDAAGVETIVVLTHWSPTRDLCAIDSRHVGSSISSAFSTNLSWERCFTSPKVKVWAFGHTHHNCDFMVERGNGAGPLRLVTNQRGYYFQQSPGFDKMKKIDFRVVPDHCLLPGENAFANVKRLTPCTNLTGCITSSQMRDSPPPACHKHIDASEVTVGLYPQSETLWFLPSLSDALSNPTISNLPPQYALASDQSLLPPWRPGRGAGVFEPGLDPVVVLKSHVLLEALLRLYARDAAKRTGGFGVAMIGYIELYVDDDGLLDVDQLPEPLRTLYKELHDENMIKPLRQWTRELREALGVSSDGSEDDFS